MNSRQSLRAVLPDFYARHPETRHLLGWELPILLQSLGYTDELLDEKDYKEDAE